MFTRREIKMMKKGFYPSRCGEFQKSATDEVIVGSGLEKNRAQRRGNQKGNHRNKGGILVVIGTKKFRSRVQIIGSVKNKKGVEISPKKKILHWDAV